MDKLQVDEESLRTARLRMLGSNGVNLEQTKSNMDDLALDLFNKFRLLVPHNVLEVPKPKSVSYHNRKTAEFVCEVLPRFKKLIVLFNLKKGTPLEGKITKPFVVSNSNEFKTIPHSLYKEQSNLCITVHSNEAVRFIGNLLNQHLG